MILVKYVPDVKKLDNSMKIRRGASSRCNTREAREAARARATRQPLASRSAPRRRKALQDFTPRWNVVIYNSHAQYVTPTSIVLLSGVLPYWTVNLFANN